MRGALLTSKNYGYEDKDSKTFTGMGERHASVDVGGRVIVDTSLGPAVFDVTKDVNSSKGYEASIKLSGIAPHAKHWTGEKKLILRPQLAYVIKVPKLLIITMGLKIQKQLLVEKLIQGNQHLLPLLALKRKQTLRRILL